MKTIKLIVLCLSLFLVSHSTFAQLSEKQITFNEKLAKYNDLVQKHKEKVQILQVIDNRIASSSLSVQEKNDLIAQRDIRYKNILKLEQNIQELDSTLKVLKYQIDIAEKLKIKEEEKRNEKQEILEWTEDLYARKISPAEYQRRIEEILFNIQRYDSQMNNIKEQLYSKVSKITNLEIEINNMQKDPNFSNEVDKIYYEEKRRYLPESTKQEIQQTYDVAVNIYANLASEKEKAEKEYEHNKKALDALCKQCPECCKPNE